MHMCQLLRKHTKKNKNHSQSSVYFYIYFSKILNQRTRPRVSRCPWEPLLLTITHILGTWTLNATRLRKK